MDMSTYTLEELEHITSEYTLRNQVGAAWVSVRTHSHSHIAPKSSLNLGPILGYLLGGCVLPDRPDCLYFGAGRCPATLQTGCVSGCSLLRAPSSPGCGCLLWLYYTISPAHLGHWHLCRYSTSVLWRGLKAFMLWVLLSPGQKGCWLCSFPFPSVLGSGLKDFTQEKSVFCRIR